MVNAISHKKDKSSRWTKTTDKKDKCINKHDSIEKRDTVVINILFLTRLTSPYGYISM